jgi:hypothetical protein
MLNKSFAFGLLAAGMMIAPGAAFAQDQVAGSSTNLNQGSAITGVGNVNGQQVNSTTIQDQFKNNSPFCASGNQVAGSNTNAGQFGATNGAFNVNGQAGSATTVQGQTSLCNFPY